MHSHLNQMETRVVSLHASDCVTKKSNVADVSSGNVTFTAHYEANGCSGGDGLALKGTEKWQPSSVAPSTLALSGFSRRANGGAKGLVYSSTPGRQQMIVVPAESKTASVRGSFAGKASYASQENLHGSIVASLDQVTGQPDAACKSLAGLSVVTIVSGVETLP
jgi:hypothetical protein